MTPDRAPSAAFDLRERALGAYLERIGQLVINDKLLESRSGSPPSVLARALTLRVLPQLDGARKAAVVQFLREAQLITRPNAIVNLRGADLRHAAFAGEDLQDVRLSAARLSDADFEGARIYSTSFNSADLRRADFARVSGGAGGQLLRTDFRNAQLNGANFEDAHIDGGSFDAADLSDARFLRATLGNARFSSACLSRADFAHADLRSAAMDALGERVRLDHAQLMGTYGNRTAVGRRLTPFPNGWSQSDSRLWQRAASGDRSCSDIRHDRYR